MATPLEPRPLREVVADEIRRMIATGEIAHGDRLVEDRLADQLGVSRNPVREAIRSLEAIGLIEVVPRRGAYVTIPDREAIDHIRELCAMVNRWVVRAAAERRDEADIARLDACIEAGRKASEEGDPVRSADSHREFHQAVEAATKNPYASLTMVALRLQAEMVLATTVRTTAHRWEGPQAIRDAIAAGDPDLAVRRSEEHIEESFAALADG